MTDRSLFSFAALRLGQGILVIILVSFLSFFLLYFSPGDCLADQRLNQSLSPEFIQAEEARRGLDRPFIEQYGRWLFNLAQGNLGRTCQGNAPVLRLIVERSGNTLIFASSAIVSTWLVAIPLGIWAAVNRSKFIDRSVQDSLHYWSGRAYLGDSTDTNDFIARQEQALFGISSTAYLRYFEVRHGLELEEPLNHAGHEIPFLLNRIDEEVGRSFNSRILQDRIALRMATQSEELFFEETNERAFR